MNDKFDIPKVSVILTSFNHAKYLREAIDSTLSQTYDNFELIIWDDASTDNSWEIIKSYNDPRIKAFRNDVQKRGIYGINKAIAEIAQGDYMAIHHSDDVWVAEKLEKQVAYLDTHTNIAAVFSWVQVIDEKGSYVFNEWFNVETKSRWQWLRLLFSGENRLAHPSVLIRRSCYDEVGVYRFGLAQTGDAEMWSRVLLSSDIYVIPERLTKHRIFSDGSNTSGAGLTKSIRTENEWGIIRLNYFSLASEADICKIFPELKRFHSPLGCDPQFLLAMACLYQCNSRAAWAMGLNTLYQLINKPDVAARLYEIYCFNYQSLIDLTGEFDPYAFGELDALAGLRASFNEQESFIGRLNSVVAERDAQITALLNSNSWKLTRGLRSLGSVWRSEFAPLLAAVRRAFGRPES